MYTIDLGNGTVLNNIELNGNNYISSENLTEDIFEDMELVSIVDNETGESEQLHNVVLVALSKYPEGWYFVLRELSEEELKAQQLEAQIFFTAIATDSLMEEEE